MDKCAVDQLARILVLGGSRFIGRAMGEALADKHNVALLVRGTSPTPEGVRMIFGDRSQPTAAELVKEQFYVIDATDLIRRSQSGIEAAWRARR